MYRIFPFILLFLFSQLHGQEYQNPEITRVLVDPETNLVHLYFTGTDHPDVQYYRISQWRITGNNPVASGVPIDNYIDHTGQASYSLELDIPEVMNEPVGFSVGAFNAAYEVLLESYPPDSTIHLTAVYDSCEASVWLQWNDYNAWRGFIVDYEIRGTNTDGSYNILVPLPEEVTETTLYGLQANNSYQFSIIAHRDRYVPDAYVTSNGVNFDSPHSFYPEFIHADYGTVNNDNHPEVQFSIDPLAEINTYNLLRSTDYLGDYDTIARLISANNLVEYTDNEVDASLQPFYYKLVAINNCNVAITESINLAGTIHLNVELNGLEVELRWSDYHEWIGGVSIYEGQRLNGEWDYFATGNTFTVAFGQDLASTGILKSEVCYRIVAHEGSENSFVSEPASSISNVVCINLPINIRFDYNAFIPGLEGFARFGPTIDFLPTEASFKIFNRWGNLVFETHDLYNLQWDGQIQGNGYAPEGVYRYQLEYKNENGNQSVIHGSVTIVRQ